MSEWKKSYGLHDRLSVDACFICNDTGKGYRRMIELDNPFTNVFTICLKHADELVDYILEERKGSD